MSMDSPKIEAMAQFRAMPHWLAFAFGGLITLCRVPDMSEEPQEDPDGSLPVFARLRLALVAGDEDEEILDMDFLQTDNEMKPHMFRLAVVQKMKDPNMVALRVLEISASALLSLSHPCSYPAPRSTSCTALLTVSSLVPSPYVDISSATVICVLKLAPIIFFTTFTMAPSGPMTKTQTIWVMPLPRFCPVRMLRTRPPEPRTSSP